MRSRFITEYLSIIPGDPSIQTPIDPPPLSTPTLFAILTSTPHPGPHPFPLLPHPIPPQPLLPHFWAPQRSWTPWTVPWAPGPHESLKRLAFIFYMDWSSKEQTKTDRRPVRSATISKNELGRFSGLFRDRILRRNSPRRTRIISPHAFQTSRHPKSPPKKKK